MPNLERSGLVWGVRRSFVEYVARAGGSVEVTRGAGTIPTGEYYFGLSDASDFDVRPLLGELRFSGSVTMSAHAGLMRFAIADPVVTFGPDGALLRSTGRGETDPAALVRLEPGHPHLTQGVLVWEALPTMLDAAATSTFNDVYPAGAPFDPVSIRVETSRLGRG
jgi:hypothetical protein